MCVLWPCDSDSSVGSCQHAQPQRRREARLGMKLEKVKDRIAVGVGLEGKNEYR